MKNVRMLTILVFGLLVCFPKYSEAEPMGTAFTYQGHLYDANEIANGQYDFQFKLYNANVGGNQVGADVNILDAEVIDGYFTVNLDFGPLAFNGDPRWLQISIMPGVLEDPNEYEILNRQRITPAPYAIYAAHTGGFSVPLIISDSSPDTILDVTNTGTGNGICGKAEGPESRGVHGIATNSGDVKNYGGYFEAAGQGGRGVYGSATHNADGTGYGGYFSAASRTGRGVCGLASNDAITSTNYGGYFQASGGSGTGVYAECTGPYGNGVHAVANAYYATAVRAYSQSGTAISASSVTGRAGSFDGTVHINGMTITEVLEITGGSDLSEGFDIRPAQIEAEPGMIVCIDPEHPGMLILSSKAYDKTVAGVISGAGGVKTGMLMGQNGTLAGGEYPVALTGRVYCLADASYGSIEAGDLLTTSNTRGYAMKATDIERSYGAVIGKAMTPLDENKGLVLVLVTLQ